MTTFNQIFLPLRTAALSACLFGIAVLPQQASAHPHEFVTMQVQAIFDFKGRMSGLTYHWEFDEFFSAYAVEGQDLNKNGKAEPTELKILLDEILGNITSIDYFSAFDPKGVVPQLATARPLKVSMQDRKLNLSFNIPFKQPLSLTGKSMRFGIFDDEFYIAMTLDPKAGNRIIPKSVGNCKAQVDVPNPDEETVAFASSLGKEDSSGGGLGASFAEWITISCK